MNKPVKIYASMNLERGKLGNLVGTVILAPVVVYVINLILLFIKRIIVRYMFRNSEMEFLQDFLKACSYIFGLLIIMSTICGVLMVIWEIAKYFLVPSPKMFLVNNTVVFPHIYGITQTYVMSSIERTAITENPKYYDIECSGVNIDNKPIAKRVEKGQKISLRVVASDINEMRAFDEKIKEAKLMFAL